MYTRLCVVHKHCKLISYSLSPANVLFFVSLLVDFLFCSVTKVEDSDSADTKC